MNTEKWTAKADALGEGRAADIRDRLLATDCPDGVSIEPTGEGVCLVGKGLRRRMLTDARLRNFGR